jgi:hypothetical protein
MNDFTVGRLASEHQRDLMRQVARDELASQYRREAERNTSSLIPSPSTARSSEPRGWRQVIGQLIQNRLVGHSERA